MQDKLARLKAWQKLFKEKVLDSKRFQWFSRGVYGLTIVWAGYLFLQSMPYYKAIGEGESLYKRGDYQSARASFETALHECEKWGPDWRNDPRSIRAMNNLAEDYRLLGMYKQAEPYYAQAIDFSRKKFAATRPELAIALNNLGMLQRSEGDYAGSDKSYSEALALWQNKVKQQDSMYAKILNGMGRLRRDQGRYDEAEKYFKQALAVSEKALGKSDVGNSYILANLGGLYSDIGKYHDAEEFYHRAYFLDSHGLKEDHPDLAQDLHELGSLMRLEGRLTEARPLYEKALAIRLKVLGPEHALTARCYTGLADLERRDHHYDKAQALIEKALAIQLKALGAVHPSIADSLDVEGMNYYVQGKIAQAKECFSGGYDIRKGILAADHPDILTSKFYLALCDKSLSQGATTDMALRLSVDNLERVLGRNHPLVVAARRLSAGPKTS